MRFLVNIEVPHEPFNTFVREGIAGEKIGRCVEETKPESIYFHEANGHRTVTAIYNIDKTSDLPSIAEPWFLTFQADCHFHAAMTPEDLGNAGLDALGKKWS